MSTQKETACTTVIETLLKENNCELVPKANLKKTAIAKVIDMEIFNTILSLVDISFEIQEKKNEKP